MTESVLHTQEMMLVLERERRELEARLAVVKARLEEAIEAHKRQIARSLTSKDPEEREMAASIREWYGIPLPDSSPSA